MTNAADHAQDDRCLMTSRIILRWSASLAFISALMAVTVEWMLPVVRPYNVADALNHFLLENHNFDRHEFHDLIVRELKASDARQDSIRCTLSIVQAVACGATLLALKRAFHSDSMTDAGK